MRKLLLAAAVVAAAALVVKKIMPSHDNCDIETVEDIIYDDSSIPKEDENSTVKPSEPVEDEFTVEESNIEND